MAMPLAQYLVLQKIFTHIIDGADVSVRRLFSMEAVAQACGLISFMTIIMAAQMVKAIYSQIQVFH